MDSVHAKDISYPPLDSQFLSHICCYANKPKLALLSRDEFNFKLTMTHLSKITTLKCPLNHLKQLKNTR